MSKTTYPGLGVMIQMLGGAQEETARAVQAALGKRIAYVMLHSDIALLMFADGTALRFWDGGQSCCESRWMTSDDVGEFDKFIGATFIGAKISDGPGSEDGNDYESETQFLDVGTTRGTIQFVTHNSHNGYYGGFSVQASNDIGALMSKPERPKRTVFIFERNERVEVVADSPEAAWAIFNDDSPHCEPLPLTTHGWRITNNRVEEIPDVQ